MGVCMTETPFWKLSSWVQAWIVTFQLAGVKEMGLVTAALDQAGQEFLPELYF